MSLPGKKIVNQGLEDTSKKELTIHSLLLQSAITRLLSVGVIVEKLQLLEPASILLFRKLKESEGNGAHSKYNALNRELLSFIKAKENERRAN